MIPCATPLGRDVGEHAVLDDRIALLSVLQELTVAVLKLFDPASPLDDFLEKLTARLGCAVTLCVEARGPGQPIALRGSSGLARGSRDMQLPDVPAGAQVPPVSGAGGPRAAGRRVGLPTAHSVRRGVAWFDREPRARSSIAASCRR
jgi:hypothetical protein